MTMVMKPKGAVVHAAGEFKTHCLRLMDEVARTGVPITVSKRGKPLVRVVPATAPELSMEEWRARCRSQITLPDDDELLVAPTGERWKAEEE